MSQQIQVQEIGKYVERLKESINTNKIDNWTIEVNRIRRNNIYGENNYKIESLLNSNREDISITVFKKFGDEIGENTFEISSSDSLDKFEMELNDAITSCSIAKNKKYELPKENDRLLNDTDIDYDKLYSKKFLNEFENNNISIFIGEKLELLKKLIDEYSNDGIKVKLNAFEFLNSLNENSLITSYNIQKEFKNQKTYCELVLTAIRKDKKETEHIVYKNISDIYNFDFESFFREEIETTLGTATATRAKNYNGKIILSGEATNNFFNPDISMNKLVAVASGRLKYQKIFSYNIEDKLINNKKDSINITIDAFYPNNSASRPYDNLGIVGKKNFIIKDNTINNIIASKQFADYLNEEPSGPMGVICIDCGNKSYNELKKDEEFIEIVSFSSFNPDVVSGDFSAEIRLGYHYKNGSKQSFKGGLFTGNIFKLLEDVELSSEKKEDVGYVGPKHIKFYNGEIVGF